MNHPPQTFDAIIKAVSEQPDGIRPIHLLFLWFTMKQTSERGIITLAGSSSMSWRADITFKEMKELGDDVIGEWDVLLMWSANRKSNKPPSQDEISQMTKAYVERLAILPKPIQDEAMFGRDGNRIDSLELSPSRVN